MESLAVKVLLFGLALPAAFCAAALAVPQRALRLGGFRFPTQWKGALALGATYISARHLLIGAVPLRPVETTHWLYWLVVVGVVAAVAPSLWTGPAAIRLGARLIAGGLLAWLTCRPMIEYQWSPAASWTIVPLLSLTVFGFWIALESLSGQIGGFKFAGSMALAAGATAAVLGMSASALLGQLAGAIAAGASVMALFIWRGSDQTTVRGAAALLALVLAGLWMNGYFYAELKWYNGCLLVLSALAPWVAALPRLRGLSPNRATVLAFASVLAIAAPVIIIAAMQALNADSGYDPYDY